MPVKIKYVPPVVLEEWRYRGQGVYENGRSVIQAVIVSRDPREMEAKELAYLELHPEALKTQDSFFDDHYELFMTKYER